MGSNSTLRTYKFFVNFLDKNFDYAITLLELKFTDNLGEFILRFLIHFLSFNCFLTTKNYKDIFIAIK